jgi:hypothetical protein
LVAIVVPRVVASAVGRHRDVVVAMPKQIDDGKNGRGRRRGGLADGLVGRPDAA